MSLLNAPALAFCFAATLTANAQPAGSARVQDVRFWSFGDVTRVVIQTQGDYKLTSDQIDNPARAYFDFAGLRPPASLRGGVQRIAVHDNQVTEIRIAQVAPGRTRVVFDLRGSAEVSSSRLVNPDRVVIEIRPKGTSIAALSRMHPSTITQTADITPVGPSASSPAPSADAATTPGSDPASNSTPGKTTPARPFVSAAAVPPQPVPTPMTVAPTASKVNSDVAAPAKADSTGEKSLVRIFGLKMGKVVIDAGHGGHDTGTIGPHGLMEKDLVLDVALRLGKLVNQRLGATVVYTRADDTFIPLEQRTKIANDEKADLFISIHANSSPEPSATGVETYFFNLTSDKRGLDLATRENAASTSSISDLNELLHKAMLNTKKEESREFAQNIQTALWSESVRMNSKSRDRGVRQAPFVVLIGAGMPSILAEVGFVSNPHDERLLKRADERQKIAEALFKGISRYGNSLSHVQVAKAE
jgi:N-acetylmuramoyl-L-alanine amidase